MPGNITRVSSTKRLTLAHFTVALCWSALSAHAQLSILPQPCVGKSGEALDKCVREITLPKFIERLEPVELKPDPTQMLNCLDVNRADQGFCIERNEIILECRNRKKYPDLTRCIVGYITHRPMPEAADCSRVKREARGACALRNKVYSECVQDPMRYFICLGEKTSGKPRADGAVK